jgi:hypothetical protein
MLLLAVALLAGCGRGANRSSHAPEQRTASVDLAGHVLAAQLAAASGNVDAARAQQIIARRQILRSMRVPDASRPIDHEAARAAVAPLEGVRGTVWLDASNLVVMVDGARYRSEQTIDRVCAALEPLGDTLAVVVNVQNVHAMSADQADTLSRNCRLPAGQRAFAQRHRQIDVVSPALRRVFEAQQKNR